MYKYKADAPAKKASPTNEVESVYEGRSGEVERERTC